MDPRARPKPPPAWHDLRHKAFAAIDFETADRGADSACALGVTRVENLRVVASLGVLIRPPRRAILYTRVHGITWAMVADEEPFAGVFPRLRHLLDGVDFLAAHNATFDRRVLGACCAAAGLECPPAPFVCTVGVARRTWNARPNNLAAVARRLAIPLTHHDAGSDAAACAHILLAAHRHYHDA